MLTELSSDSKEALESPYRHAPIIYQIMKSKLDQAVQDETFVAFFDRVKAELHEKFFGSNCLVQLNGEPKEHVQTLVWLYRRSGWNVDCHPGIDGSWYLVFHDPLALTDKQ